MTVPYDTWFRGVTGIAAGPHPWQARLAADAACADRLIRIPTGFGKTAGTVLAWLYRRVVLGDTSWPTRLVLVLPMRVLVEQAVGEIRRWTAAAGLDLETHLLMGGVDAGAWALEPERPAVLVGTQDMLLSRALNRGYSASRGRWPIDFGLLHHDALWVLDEVQLMGVGLPTTAQLAAFRRSDEEAGSERVPLRPAATWWMSATLRPEWLESPETRPWLPRLVEGCLSIPEPDRKGGLWSVSKGLERSESATPAEVAALVRARHEAGSLTLVVVNRVERAIEVFDALTAAWTEGKGKKAQLAEGAPDLRLVHSRFRGAERSRWAASGDDGFLRRGAAVPPAGRVIVATQVVEAGVDLSARLLVTDLAPWSSVVQRLGRLARYAGEQGQAVVVGVAPDDDKGAAPYAAADLVAASEALVHVAERGGDAGLGALEATEAEIAERAPELLTRMFRQERGQLLLRDDLEELFDTSADLSGVDLDVSPFIREGDERDVQVAWRALDGDPGDPGEEAAPKGKSGVRLAPLRREELCPVPVYRAREWLKGKKALVRRYDDGLWSWLGAEDLRRLVPGASIVVPAAQGGYDPARGFDPKASAHVPVVDAPDALLPELAEALERSGESADDDALSAARAWKSIATHGKETAEQVRDLAAGLELPEALSRLLDLAARWHDAGKGHEVFQRAIRDEARAGAGPAAARRDFAKAPEDAWAKPAYRSRPGFRHELVSALGLLEALRRAAPEHPALLGGHGDLLAALGAPTPAPPEPGLAEHPLVRELVALDAQDFDLVLFLVAAHHGKVRCRLSSTPRDLEGGADRPTIHGVADGDVLPSLRLADEDGGTHPLPALEVSLEPAELGFSERFGPSWSERVDGLRRRHGPFRLAFLEALLRIADVRASRLTTKDPLL